MDMKSTRVWWIFVGASVLASASLMGCSSSGSGKSQATGGAGGTAAGKPGMLSCAISKCPNATVIFDSESQCDAIWNGPCPKEYKAYQKCYLDNEVCGSDGQATIESTSKCDDLTNALGACTAAH